MKSCIEQETIANLPKIELDDLSNEENTYINSWIQNTLQYAKDKNECKEVGVMLDKTDWSKYDIVLGKASSVTYNTEKMMEWLDDGNNNLILIHNHPNNSIFSDRDINNFCRTQAVNTVIVVGNNGTIYVLQKLEGFNNLKFIRIYSKLKEKNKHRHKRSEILQYTLETYQEEFKFKYRKEEIKC